LNHRSFRLFLELLSNVLLVEALPFSLLLVSSLHEIDVGLLLRKLDFSLGSSCVAVLLDLNLDIFVNGLDLLLSHENGPHVIFEHGTNLLLL